MGLHKFLGFELLLLGCEFLANRHRMSRPIIKMGLPSPFSDDLNPCLLGLQLGMLGTCFLLLMII